MVGVEEVETPADAVGFALPLVVGPHLQTVVVEALLDDKATVTANVQLVLERRGEDNPSLVVDL